MSKPIYVKLENAKQVLWDFRYECLQRGIKEDTVRGIQYAAEELMNVPVADVEEVRHGKWIATKTESAWNNAEYPTEFRCSLCGRTEQQQEPYCNCGAKMSCV